MYYLKPALTLSEQVDLLVSRGMIIDNREEAEQILGETNYYRFSGYAFLYQKANDRFRKGTTFNEIMQLISFDQKLRSILMDYLEIIEVYSRSKIAYVFSLNHERNGGAYYDSSFFDDKDFHKEFIQALEEQIKNNSQQPFVAHHINSFGGKMPLWCAVEILSFSRLSKLYSNMLQEDKELIAANMDTDTRHLTNWLHCFSVLRNSCAHYSRLYQNIFSPSVSLDPSFLRKHKDVMLNTLFACIIAMLRILPRNEWKSGLRESVVTLANMFPGVNLSGIGFPSDWKEILQDSEIIKLRPVSPERKIIKDIPPIPSEK